MSRFIWFRACLIFALLSTTAGDALAFCRTTTCNPKTSTCEFDEHGCNLTGVPLYWEHGSTSINVAAAGSPLRGISAEELQDATRAAIATWEDARCADGGKPAFQISAPGVVQDATPTFDEDGPNENVVTFVDEGWGHETDAIAKTSVGFYVRSGRLLDADIELNSDLFDFTVTGEPGVSDLQAVLTHEVGHALGVDHSDVPGSTMAARTVGSSARDLRTLHSDDVDAICSVYPPAEPPGESGCKLAPESTKRGAAWPACLVALVAAVRARRRRSRP